MPRERTLWILLVLLVAAGVVGGLLNRQERKVEVPLADGLPAPVPAADWGRVWKPFPGEELAARPYRGTPTAAAEGRGEGEEPHRRDTLPLGSPAILAATDGALYLVDFEDLRLKALSPELELARVLAPPAPAPGEPPAWETRQIMDVEVAGGKVWVCDPQGRQVLALDPDGTLDRRLRMENGPLRLAVTGDGGVTVLVPTAGDHAYESYGPDGGLRLAFGRLFEPDYQMPYTLDGMVAADGGGGIVHVLRNRGLIAGWNADGTLRFLVEPVEPHPPAPMIEERGRLHGDPEAPFSVLDATVHGGLLYVLTTRDGTMAGDGVVDIYATTDGAYLHSWRLPEPWRHLAFTAERIWALTAEAVQGYRWGGAEEAGAALPPTSSARSPAAVGGGTARR